MVKKMTLGANQAPLPTVANNQPGDLGEIPVNLPAIVLITILPPLQWGGIYFILMPLPCQGSDLQWIQVWQEPGDTI